MLDAKTYKKFNFRLASCQDDLNEAVKDLTKVCNRLYDIQLRGSMSTDANADSLNWVEELVSATAEAKELKAKVQKLKEQRALLCQFLAENDGLEFPLETL